MSIHIDQHGKMDFSDLTDDLLAREKEKQYSRRYKDLDDLFEKWSES